MNHNSVLIGMSGGVDSSVAAHLLQQQGYVCVGCTMKLYCGNAEQNVHDAQAVANRMGVCFKASQSHRITVKISVYDILVGVLEYWVLSYLRIYFVNIHLSPQNCLI